MTVSTTNARMIYNGDGVSTTFYTPYFLKDADLKVYVDGALKVLTTDYAVSGAGVAAGGSVIFVSAPSAGSSNVIIIREPERLQQTQLPANDPFPSKAVETAIDKLTMLVQRLFDKADLSISIADNGTGPYLAKNNRIESLADPVNAQDAINKTFMYSAIAQAVTASAINFPTTNIKQYGATGDGVTDDTAAIQTGVNFGGTIVFPRGTYKLTSSIVVPSNTCIQCDEGVTLDISSAASGSHVFDASGTFGAAYALTANAAVGATSVTLSAPDATNFAAADWVQIYSSTVYDTGWTDAVIGEIVQVESSAAGVVTFKSPLVGGPYNTASTAMLRKCNFVSNVSINGGTFVGSSNPATIHTACYFDVAYRCKVSDLSARYCNGNAITFRSSIFCRVNDVLVTDAMNTSSGYGVNFTDTCQDCLVTDSTFARVRHAVTNTASDKGIARRITYQNLRCLNTINSGDAFDTHANGEDLLFLGCMSFDSEANGFNIECGSARLLGCKAIRSGSNGISLTAGATIKLSHFSVESCDVNTATTYGIRCNQGSTVNSATTEKVSIAGCSAVGASVGAYLSGNASLTIENAEVAGGYFSGTSTNGAIYVGDYVKKFRLGAHASTNQAGGSAIQLNGSNVSYGSIDGCLAEHSVSGATGASSSAAIRLTNCSNISLSNNVVRQPASAGGHGIRTTGSVSNIYVGAGNNCADATNPGAGISSTLTIAAGVITLPHGGNMLVTIDTESAAATDDLDTINGGVLGQMITLTQANSARDPTIKDNTGNLRLAGDFIMTAVQDSITLISNGSLWIEVGRADVA